MKESIAFVVKVRTYLRRYMGLSSELHPLTQPWNAGCRQTMGQLCDNWHKLVVFQAVSTERGATKGKHEIARERKWDGCKD